MKTLELQISGMTCGHCVRAVQDALLAVSGVREARVEIGRAEIDIDDGVLRAQLVEAVREEEFEVVG